MGEAKRKHATLDGGPPSNGRIVLQIDIFDPLEAMLAMDDEIRLAALLECQKRAHQRPTAICGACDYEFSYGQPPALLFITRPVSPKSENHVGISGMICQRCAARPASELGAAIVSRLRAVKPDVTVVEMGTA
jgi:hypothetical protein